MTTYGKEPQRFNGDKPHLYHINIISAVAKGRFFWGGGGGGGMYIFTYLNFA